MLESYLLALTAFIVTIDPLGMVPIFLALTGQADRAARKRIALRGTMIGAVLLLLFALLGDRVLLTLGISLPAFRIAGGLMLLAIGFEMVFEKRSQRRNHTAEVIRDERQQSTSPGEDVAVFPLAVPLIAGPGAIAAVILQMSSHNGDVAAQGIVILALGSALAGLLIMLLLAARIAHLLSPTMVTILSRLLGLMLAALAVQFIIDGIKRAFGLD
ncbi:MAG: MarC family protein [Geminicoccaceae bacterium]|nr:MarC family protein [Geminicoccaceae bacterium]